MSKVPCQEQEHEEGHGQLDRTTSKSWTGQALEEVLRAAEDRKRWRKIDHDAAKLRIDDG